MPIHPEIAKILAVIPPAGATPPDVTAWRAMGEQHVPPADERMPQLHAVDDAVVPGPDADVPVRMYTPVEADSYGILVYLHGGAFFSGSLDTHDAVARALAAASGFRVISVGYRLAPEHAFPAGIDDSYAVVTWIVEHGDELKWDGTRLAVAGDSSGGTFVAAVAAKAHDEGRDAITHQVLLYPSVDLDFDLDRYPSRRENAFGYGLESVALAPHNSFYLDGGADPADPLVSPIRRADLSGLPQALVVTAEFDPLRDEGEAYAQRLADAGVPATVHRYAGANHGFVVNFGWIPEFAAVFAEVGDFVNDRRS
ncbi:alpha/beta hydrolase [Microbacterium fluvii]|uniref:Alpha/beta hydrolase n=1 Tax=Microbacterium fluvii TaxID=415215 RepID=A0ABW2HBL0_9MICO|nr:alpha/beta hydrolase [Microbacterium fluvii]MCU4672297.1 alpha/beta hydrolase [Microbacterium fluvii]